MAGGGGGNEGEVDLNLTALLDVLTNLLFFLMFGFAAQDASMNLDDGFTLPESTSNSNVKTAIQVTVGTEELRVEKRMVAHIKDGKVVEQGSRRNIEPLYQELVSLKSQKAAQTIDSPDVLVVLCDKDTSYSLLHEVLQTGAQAGFPKYRLAVLQK